jgi:hypothetical protein|tara:strand:+ start:375 stop:494 length:120 start_codon:yes stop_codon:yes gene_type:complete
MRHRRDQQRMVRKAPPATDKHRDPEIGEDYIFQEYNLSS